MFMAFLPTLTVACGLGMIAVGRGTTRDLQPEVWLALSAAAIAPLGAAIALRIALPGGDVGLVATAGMLAAIGSVMLFLLASAPGGNQDFYLSVAVRHGTLVGVGFVALLLGAAAAGRIGDLIRYPLTLLVVAMALTAITAVFGSTVNGAKLWLQLGPLRFQPSEIGRLLLAVFVGVYLYERRHVIAAPWRVWTLDLPPAPYLVPLVAAVSASVAVLVVQNDLGMSALIAAGALAAASAVLQSRMAVALALTAVAASGTLSYALVPRVSDRVAAWLDPWTDPSARGFQFVQAEFSLAAGGLAGWTPNTSAASVPEVHTDMMLIAVGSHLGWLGAVAVLALGIVLLCRSMLAAFRCRSGVGPFVALSITALLGIQFLLIVGGSLRLVPLTGLTIPIVSYGGTSMLMTLFAIGVIIRIGAEGN
jgi:cell division protein FtsW (lipid II flippase)